MIDILNPQLDSNYADYWAEYLPYELENWWPIVNAGCYVPRWYMAPSQDLMNMTAGQYVEFALQLPAGSFILAIGHSPKVDEKLFTAAGLFTCQITDVSVDHQWFSNPVPDAFFFKQNGTRNGYVLPKPYPVILPGNFRTEFWCRTAGICELTFAVAVPEVK